MCHNGCPEEQDVSMVRIVAKNTLLPPADSGLCALIHTQHIVPMCTNTLTEVDNNVCNIWSCTNECKFKDTFQHRQTHTGVREVLTKLCIHVSF